jgi:hypothetical protein
MPKSKAFVIITFAYTFFHLFLPTAVRGQQAEIDQRSIRILIDKWNFANNSRSLESFSNTYAADLIFYGKLVSKKRAIELKQKLFKTNPDFRQRIVSDIRYTPYTSGVVKCDFTKEVREYTRWKQYPSYLLVSYDRGRYRITGESDYVTDKNLGYRLSIGEPILLQVDGTLEVSQQNRDSMIDLHSGVVDTTVALSSVDAQAEAESRSEKQTDGLTSLGYILSPQDTVTVRKDHVFILIGILIVGAVMIFISDSAKTVRRQRAKAAKKSGQPEQVERYRAQSQFQTFVLTLFDPLYFRYRRVKKEHVMAGNVSSAGMAPDLQFQFRHKEESARFSVHCVYHEHGSQQQVQLFTREELTKLKYFSADLDGELYYILGIGGRPDDPRELFVIPASQIDREFITREELEMCRKSGMFFYNNSTGRLQ